MDTVKILHCADLHIGAAESFLGSLSKSRRAETLITFEKIISLAREEGVALLLIAGDLFDSNNIEESFVMRVIEQFKAIPETEIVYCAGNHDPLNLSSPFAKYNSLLPENFHILPCFDSMVELKELNTRVFGRSFDEVYMDGCEAFSVTPDESHINIMCLHADLGASADTKYNPIQNGFISESRMDYIALGHIHKRSEVSRLNSTYYAYSGCPEGQGFDEGGEKGVLIGEVGKGVNTLSFFPTSRRIHATERFSVTGIETSGEIAEGILKFLKEKYGDNYSDNLYKIILVGETDQSVKLSCEEICSRVAAEVYFAKVKDNTQIAVDLKELSREESLKGIFVRNMLSRIESAEKEEKELLSKALDLGLKAFLSEVKCDED